MKFIVLSDLHLIAGNGLLHGIAPSDRLEQCLDDIQTWHGDAAFCVISGDLADLGAPEAYAYLRDRLARFPLPVALMIGNHDNRRAFQTAFPDAPRGFVQHSLEAEGEVFLFLDTVTDGPDTHEGVLCDERLAWLESQLARAGHRPVHIFMHHPPFDIGIEYVDAIKLRNGAEFFRVLTSGANIRQVYFGHVHRMTSVQWNGIPFVSVPGVNHQVPLVAESVSGEYSDEPPAYAVVLTEDAQTTVHFDAFLHRKSLIQGKIRSPTGSFRCFSRRRSIMGRSCINCVYRLSLPRTNTLNFRTALHAIVQTVACCARLLKSFKTFVTVLSTLPLSVSPQISTSGVLV